MAHVVSLIKREDKFDEFDVLPRNGRSFVLDDVDEQNVDAPGNLVKKVSGYSEYSQSLHLLMRYRKLLTP